MIGMFYLFHKEQTSMLYYTNKKALIGFGSDIQSLEFSLRELLGFEFSNEDFFKIIKRFNVGTLLVHSSFMNIEALKTLQKENF